MVMKVPETLTMKGSFSRAEKVAITVGYFFIIVGFVFNEWLLALMFSSDGNLRILSRITICVVDFLMIVSGFSLIYFGRIHQLKNLVMLTITVLVCFLFAEIFFRLIEPKPIENLYFENTEEGASYRLRPNLNVETKFGVIKTNSYGMGWKEVSIKNQFDKTRIAFVGDSFTFGLWADSVEYSAVGIVASLLDSEKFEVLNFGVPGYGPPDTELQIKREVLAFRPDYIILLFYNGNDLRDAYLGPNKYKIINGAQVWDKKNNEHKKVPAEFRATELMFYLDRLAIYRRLNSSISILLSDKNSVKTHTNFRASRLFGVQSFWSHKVYPDVAIKAKDKALKALDNIRQLISEDDIQLIIVTIPYEEQVYTASLTGKNYDLNLPQMYLQEYAEAQSIPYLDLLPILRSYVRREKESIYVANDVHLNNKGHYIVGKAVADFFKRSFEQ